MRFKTGIYLVGDLLIVAKLSLTGLLCSQLYLDLSPTSYQVNAKEAID